MAWREHMGPATFRGVPFFVETGDLVGGRKSVVHEYPLQDEPFVEDLGRRARAFHVEGYVVGDDYLAARDALADALEAPGPGTLVHPYHGTRIVAVAGPFRVQESRDEGGLARFSIEFVETAPRAFAPIVVDDPVVLVNRSSATALEAASGEFTKSYRLTTTALAPSTVTKSLPGFVFESASGLLRGAADDLRTFLAPVVKGTQALASLNRQIDGLFLDADMLVRSPFLLAERLQETFASIVRLPPTPGFGRLARLAVIPAVARPVGSTVTRQHERANFDALQSLIHRDAIITTAQVAVRATYESHESAVAAREAILEQLDAEAETADVAYSALVQLGADLAKAVPGAAHQLARLMTYTPATTAPSLVIAYGLYGSIERDADIVARNRIRHPGFVVGGRTLQVLSRG